MLDTSTILPSVSHDRNPSAPRSRQHWETSPSPLLPPTPRAMQNAHAQDRPASIPAKMRTHCDFSNLMSPPAPAPLDAFKAPAPATASGKAAASHHDAAFPHAPLSPPVSPYSQASNTIDSAPSLGPGGKDPILYPAGGLSAGAAGGPLFSLLPESVENFNRAAAARVVDQHIASRPPSLFRDVSPPRHEDYELALHFKSNCFRLFKENPNGWLRNERALLRADRKRPASSAPPAKAPPNKLQKILPAAKPAVPGPQPANASSERVQKPKPPKAKTQNPRPIRATPAAPGENGRQDPPEQPRVRTVAPNREDKDFGALEDLSPPISTLDALKQNCLKVDWKGNPLDLSGDPHRHLLHREEVSLASSLRLDCATYLTSKRRIFLARLDCAHKPKEFRKTDAQQACNIDVNKASKLWAAFERVGWLDLKWMQEPLKRFN